MAVISSLQAGLQVNSTGNTKNTGQISFTGTNDANGFFPIYDGATTTSGTGKLLTGGVFLTINPGAGIAGAIQTLIKGEAATLSIEYNMANSGQFRFDLTPLGSVTISSQWLNVGSEHSVGVSYDTTSGVTILSVDGASHTTVANYTTTGTSALSADTVFASNSGALTTTPTYNGIIDQITTFNVAPSAVTLNTMTADPVSAAAALSTHLETQTIALATTLTGLTDDGTGHLTSTNSIYGVALYDTVTDATNPNAIPGGIKVVSISAGTIQLSNSTSLASSSDVLVFTHSAANEYTGTVLTASTDVLTLSAVTGVQAGDFVAGFDIPANTTVKSVDSATTVKLSNSIGSTVLAASGQETVLFTHPASTANVTLNANYTQGHSTLGVLSQTGIQIGDIAISGDIPAYDHVIGLDGSGTVTLEMPVISGNTSASVTFVHSSGATAKPSSSTATTALTVGTLIGNIQIGDIVTDTTTTGSLINEVVANVNGNGTSVTLAGVPVASLATTDSLTFTHTTSTTTQGTAAAGSSVLTLTSGQGVQVGDLVVDNTTNLNTDGPSHTGLLKVTQVSGNKVTLSGTVDAAGFTGDTLSFIHPPKVSPSSPAYSTIPPATSGTTVKQVGYQVASESSKTVYLNNNNGILIGDYVTGPNIPANDTVQSVSTDGNSIGLTTGTTLTDGVGSVFTFTHPTNANIQEVSIASTTIGTSTTGTSYTAGNTITITANVNANTTVSASYTVASSDIGTTPAVTEANIAKSFVNANPTLGAFTLIAGATSGTIDLVPQTGTAQVLPLATVTSSDSAGINENTIADFFNFSNINTATSTTTGANGGVAHTIDSTGINSNSHTTTVASVSYATAPTTLATPQAHGPVYAELSSLDGTTAVYNLFVDGSAVANGVLNSAGMTINVPTTQGTITSITPAASGTISQVNNTGNGSISYQWASNSGVTNFTQPIGQMTLSLTSNAINSLSATVTNMSINNKNFMDPVQPVPMLETSTLNSQVYTVSGHFFDQFNSNGVYGLTNAGTLWNDYTTQTALPNNDFSYTVAGSANSDLKLSVEQANLSPATPSAPTAIALDLVASSMPTAWTSAKAMPFTVTIDVPSNATGVTFTPTSGVTLTSGASTVGHTLTLTGTYTAPGGKGAVATSTPTLGTLNATLNNEFNNGGQFSMDTVSINGSAATGQSLYFGMGQTDATGAYSLSNLPVGSLAIKPFNNVSQINPSSISVDDVLAVMTIAAGKGVPSGLGQAIGAASYLLPSDYVAADFNQDGQVTAADALSMLNYIVSVNKSAAPGYVYMSAAGNALINTAESATAVVVPSIAALPTNLSPANAALTTGDSSKVIDIIGVLPGNVVSY